MMTLTLLRHATAQDHGLGPDGDRKLIAKGISQSHRAAAFAQTYGITPDLVLTSPLTRALETATIFCNDLRLDSPSPCPWLAIGGGPEEICAELSAYGEFPHVMIVGHNPDFASLVEHLIGCSGGAVKVKKASLIQLEIHALRRGGATLQFCAPSAMMK